MPKDTEFDSIDLETLCPNKPVITKASTWFQLIEIDKEYSTHIYLFDYIISLKLYTLFELYYIPKLIDEIVIATNKYKRKNKEAEEACRKK